MTPGLVALLAAEQLKTQVQPVFFACFECGALARNPSAAKWTACLCYMYEAGVDINRGQPSGPGFVLSGVDLGQSPDRTGLVLCDAGGNIIGSTVL